MAKKVRKKKASAKKAARKRGAKKAAKTRARKKAARSRAAKKGAKKRKRGSAKKRTKKTAKRRTKKRAKKRAKNKKAPFRTTFKVSNRKGRLKCPSGKVARVQSSRYKSKSTGKTYTALYGRCVSL